MKKTLLLLGASSDQLFAIRTARAMGLRVVTVDQNPSSPGFALADDYAVISTRDLPALLRFVDRYRMETAPIAGVLVMGSDIPHIVASLARHLGTPGIAPEAARLATHKYEMKRRLQERGVPVPWFTLLESRQELEEICARKGFPLVLKPVDRSGARGVFRLTPGVDVGPLYERARELSFSGQVLVEEYIPGLQISTESLVYRGRAYTPGFADRNYEMLEVYAPHVIENGAWVPSQVDSETRRAVEDLVEKAALALGVMDGVVKGDVVIGPRGPVLIEMAARLSGGDFCESLIPLGSGVNLVESAIRVALGEEPELESLKPRWEKGVVNRYFFPPPGRLVRIEGVEAVRAQPWLRKLEFWYRPGDLIPPVQSHADRFGVFIAEGESRREAEARTRWVYETIRIVVEPVEQPHRPLESVSPGAGQPRTTPAGGGPC